MRFLSVSLREWLWRAASSPLRTDLMFVLFASRSPAILRYQLDLSSLDEHEHNEAAANQEDGAHEEGEGKA